VLFFFCAALCNWIEQGLTSHSTHFRSFWRQGCLVRIYILFFVFSTEDSAVETLRSFFICQKFHGNRFSPSENIAKSLWAFLNSQSRFPSVSNIIIPLSSHVCVVYTYSCGLDLETVDRFTYSASTNWSWDQLLSSTVRESAFCRSLITRYVRCATQSAIMQVISNQVSHLYDWMSNNAALITRYTLYVVLVPSVTVTLLTILSYFYQLLITPFL